MDNEKQWKFDLSSLIQGTRSSITKQTYEEDGGDLQIKVEVQRVDKGERYIGIKISLEATYTGDGGYDGVAAVVSSKGRRPNMSFYYRFGEEPKELLVYNEWVDLQRGNLGDYLHEMKYLDMTLGKTYDQNVSPEKTSSDAETLEKQWEFDLSSLIQGTRPSIIKQHTYKEDGGDLQIKVSVQRVDRGGGYIGIKISLEATYTGDGGYDGVAAVVSSKGRRPNMSFYYRFGEKPKELLVYNEWVDLQRGNLGDYLREMKYLDMTLEKTYEQNVSPVTLSFAETFESGRKTDAQDVLPTPSES